MENKTNIEVAEGQLDVHITRDFDLGVDLLFKAYSEAEFLEQWMGTKLVKMESKKHGSWHMETKDAEGNVVFSAQGVIRDIVANQKLTRTFEMDNTPFGVQLELYTFEKVSDTTSRLHMHVIYESAALRDQILQFGLVQGLTMAHNRIQEIWGN